MFTLTLAALLNFTYVGDATPANTAPVSYAEAYKVATTQAGRPLVVLVGADWCPYCQQMKQSVLPQVKGDGVLGKVAFAEVNTDKDGALAGQMMDGGMIPQLVMFVRTDGKWTRQQLTGPKSVSEVESFIAGGLNKPIATVGQR